MGSTAGPRPVGVWYAAAWQAGSEPERWVLRVSMTTEVDGGARHDHNLVDIEEACRLLRAWYLLVVSGGSDSLTGE